MFRAALRLVGDTALVALVLFVPAGTVQWSRAWVLLGVLLIIRLAGAYGVSRVSPALLRERAGLPLRPGQPASDRALVLAVLGTGFLGLPLLASVDRYHWQTFPSPALFLSTLGLLTFAAGWMLKNIALRANAYAVTTVRLQSERAHRVADTGVYGIIRHPFYAGDPLIFVGLGLWLQSYLVVCVAIVPVTLMLVRLVLEERFLLRELPDYGAYVERVRHRLVPGIW
jgi:protein-S-isoprenylcysteine O-methyltransferase Ste14